MTESLCRRQMLSLAVKAVAASSLVMAGCSSQSTNSRNASLPVQTSWKPYEAYPNLKERFVDVEGARLWTTDTGGDGEAIVLLHAHTGSAANWGYQQRFFSEKGYRVIAYSRRGYYGTELVEGEELVGMASASADLYAVVEALQLQKFHLLGTAAGGMVAADFALSHPNRLLSLTIACSLVGISDEDYKEGTRRLLPKEFHALPPEYKELSGDYMLANPEGVEQWKALEQLSKPNRDLFDFSRFRASANRITSDNLKKLDIPTLIIAGDSDQYFPQWRAEQVALMFGNGRYQLIPKSRHSPYWEQYEPFNQSLLGFIASVQ